jgi:hypothetical protein
VSQAERQDAGSDEPDVLLDVPVLKVEEIDGYPYTGRVEP